MEMCYAGALVMPSSYAMMDDEEMMYVEGGAKKLITTISATDCCRLAAVVGYLSLASTYKGLNIYYNTKTLAISCSIKK